MTTVSKWPKILPPLTPEQKRISDEFMKLWHEVLPNRYGILDDRVNAAQRGTFIIDMEGVLRYYVVSDLGIGRSVAETLRVLKALQTGELCQAEWKPGEKTLGKP